MASIRNKRVTGQENVTGGTRQAVLKNRALENDGPITRGAARRPALGDLRNRTNLIIAEEKKVRANFEAIVKPDVRKPLRESKRNIIAENKAAVAAASAALKQAKGSSTSLSSEGPLPSQVHKTTSYQPRGKVLPSGLVLRPCSRNSSANQSVEKENDVHMESPQSGSRSPEVHEPSMSEAFSADVLAAVPNIDAGDEENPLMVADYVNEIYAYLRGLEKAHPIKEKFLNEKKVTSKMRAVLIDWLVQVQLRFQLLPETLYMTVGIIDRYLQNHEVAKTELQLVGVTAMFIASKYEEIYAPEANDFVYITDESCSAQAIRAMEIQILRAFDFCLGRPLPIHFLRRFSKAADANAEMHTLAKYLCELSLIDYSLAWVEPSRLAAAACYMSIKLLCDSDNEWDSKMEHYSTYKEDEILPTVRTIVATLIRTGKPDCKFQSVKNKFSSQKHMKISVIPELEHHNLRTIFHLTD